MSEYFYLIDTRTGKRAGVASFRSRGQAAEFLARVRERDARGGRPDLHDVAPFLAIAEGVTP